MMSKPPSTQPPKSQENLLDEALRLTFPASDPIAIPTSPTPPEVESTAGVRTRYDETHVVSTGITIKTDA